MATNKGRRFSLAEFIKTERVKRNENAIEDITITKVTKNETEDDDINSEKSVSHVSTINEDSKFSEREVSALYPVRVRRDQTRYRRNSKWYDASRKSVIQDMVDQELCGLAPEESHGDQSTSTTQRGYSKRRRFSVIQDNEGSSTTMVDKLRALEEEGGTQNSRSLKSGRSRRTSRSTRTLNSIPSSPYSRSRSGSMNYGLRQKSASKLSGVSQESVSFKKEITTQKDAGFFKPANEKGERMNEMNLNDNQVVRVEIKRGKYDKEQNHCIILQLGEPAQERNKKKFDNVPSEPTGQNLSAGARSALKRHDNKEKILPITPINEYNSKSFALSENVHVGIERNRNHDDQRSEPDQLRVSIGSNIASEKFGHNEESKITQGSKIATLPPVKSNSSEHIEFSERVDDTVERNRECNDKGNEPDQPSVSVSPNVVSEKYGHNRMNSDTEMDKIASTSSIKSNSAETVAFSRSTDNRFEKNKDDNEIQRKRTNEITFPTQPPKNTTGTDTGDDQSHAVTDIISFENPSEMHFMDETCTGIRQRMGSPINDRNKNPQDASNENKSIRISEIEGRENTVTRVSTNPTYTPLISTLLKDVAENGVEHSKGVEDGNDVEDGKDVKDSKDVKDNNDVEDGNNRKDMENGKDVQDGKDAEDGNNVDNSKDVENNKGVKNSKDVKDIKDMEDNKDVDDSKDIEDDKKTEDGKNVKDEKEAENGKDVEVGKDAEDSKGVKNGKDVQDDKDLKDGNNVDNSKDVENNKGVKNSKDVKDINDMEDNKDVDDSKDVEDDKKAEDGKNVKDEKDAENGKDVKDGKDAEDSKGVKNVKDVEDSKDVEDEKDLNDSKGMGGGKDVKEGNDVEDDNGVEDVKDVEDDKGVENSMGVMNVDDGKDVEDCNDMEDDKDVEDIEDYKDVKDGKDMEDDKAVKDGKDVEDDNNVKDDKDMKDFKDAEAGNDVDDSKGVEDGKDVDDANVNKGKGMTLNVVLQKSEAEQTNVREPTNVNKGKGMTLNVGLQKSEAEQSDVKEPTNEQMTNDQAVLQPRNNDTQLKENVLNANYSKTDSKVISNIDNTSLEPRHKRLELLQANTTGNSKSSPRMSKSSNDDFRILAENIKLLMKEEQEHSDNLVKSLHDVRVHNSKLYKNPELRKFTEAAVVERWLKSQDHQLAQKTKLSQVQEGSRKTPSHSRVTSAVNDTYQTHSRGTISRSTSPENNTDRENNVKENSANQTEKGLVENKETELENKGQEERAKIKDNFQVINQDKCKDSDGKCINKVDKKLHKKELLRKISTNSITSYRIQSQNSESESGNENLDNDVDTIATQTANLTINKIQLYAKPHDEYTDHNECGLTEKNHDNDLIKRLHEVDENEETKRGEMEDIQNDTQDVGSSNSERGVDKSEEVINTRSIAHWDTEKKLRKKSRLVRDKVQQYNATNQYHSEEQETPEDDEIISKEFDTERQNSNTFCHNEIQHVEQEGEEVLEPVVHSTSPSHTKTPNEETEEHNNGHHDVSASLIGNPDISDGPHKRTIDPIYPQNDSKSRKPNPKRIEILIRDEEKNRERDLTLVIELPQNGNKTSEMREQSCQTDRDTDKELYGSERTELPPLKCEPPLIQRKERSFVRLRHEPVKEDPEVLYFIKQAEQRQRSKFNELMRELYKMKHTDILASSSMSHIDYGYPGACAYHPRSFYGYSSDQLQFESVVMKADNFDDNVRRFLGYTKRKDRLQTVEHSKKYKAYIDLRKKLKHLY